MKRNEEAAGVLVTPAAADAKLLQNPSLGAARDGGNLSKPQDRAHDVPEVCEESLLTDLRATFPGLVARPLREFGAPGWVRGVWTGGDACMPDGLPIFSPLEAGDEYDGEVHTAFLTWLAARGWYVENYDGETFFIVPAGPELQKVAS